MAGRGKGKATILKEQGAKALVAVAQIIDPEEQLDAAKELFNEATKQGNALGKNVLRRFMVLFETQALRHLSKEDGGTAETTDKAMFTDWAKLACAAARDLAPYQSPTFKAVAVSAYTPPANPVDKPGDVVKLPMDADKAQRVYLTLIRGNADDEDRGSRAG